MKDEAEKVVPPGFNTEEVVFKNHIDQENGTVIDIVFGHEQSLVKYPDKVPQILVKRFMVDHKKLVVERGEVKKEDLCI